MKLAEHWREWEASDEEWAALKCAQKEYEMSDGDNGAALAARVAELLESYADRMDRSILVRLGTTAFTPADLRAEAAEWRQKVAQ